MERVVTVAPDDGFDRDVAGDLATVAGRYDCALALGPADGSEEPVDARSRDFIAALDVAEGDDVRLVAEGTDAAEALDALSETVAAAEVGSD